MKRKNTTSNIKPIIKEHDNTPGYYASFKVAEQLSRLLEKQNLNRADLAHLLGASPTTVTKWFSPGRNLTIFTAAAIADALGAELDILVVERKT